MGFSEMAMRFKLLALFFIVLLTSFDGAHYTAGNFPGTNKITIPHMERNRALILVDMQMGNVTDYNKWIVPNIEKLVREGNYTCLVLARLRADTGSIWDKQVDFTFPLAPLDPSIKSLTHKNIIYV